MIPEADTDGRLHYMAEGGWSLFGAATLGWLRGMDLNHRPLGYEFHSRYPVVRAACCESVS